MTPGRGFLRENIFLVAAVSLPLIVVAFFLAASAIPRFIVPPPAYDLLVRTDDLSQANPRIHAEFNVRGEKVEATFRVAPANTYQLRSVLFLFDHTTLTVREVPIELPDNFVEGDPPRTIVIEALAGREALAPPIAPDGYRVEERGQRGPGLIGDLFGMGRYDSSASLVNRGRVIRIALPAPFQENYSRVYTVGWLVPAVPGAGDGQR